MGDSSVGKTAGAETDDVQLVSGADGGAEPGTDGVTDRHDTEGGAETDPEFSPGTSEI